MNRLQLTRTALVLTLSAGLAAASGVARADDHRDNRNDRNDQQRSERHHERHDDRGNDRWDRSSRDRSNGGQSQWRGRDDHAQDYRGQQYGGQGRQWHREGSWQNNQPDYQAYRRDDRSWRGQWAWQGNSGGYGYGGGYGGYQRGYGYSTPTYRYSYGGRYYETGDYGASLLRNALSYGYRQGVMAARQARASNWGYDFRSCDAYRDGSYGYEDGYVDSGQYSFYYRQGFERGYNEAYSGNYHYGAYRNGGVEVVVDLLDLILDLHHLH